VTDPAVCRSRARYDQRKALLADAIAQVPAEIVSGWLIDLETIMDDATIELDHRIGALAHLVGILSVMFDEIDAPDEPV
jgi:hypothetical protein